MRRKAGGRQMPPSTRTEMRSESERHPHAQLEAARRLIQLRGLEERTGRRVREELRIAVEIEVAVGEPRAIAGLAFEGLVDVVLIDFEHRMLVGDVEDVEDQRDAVVAAMPERQRVIGVEVEAPDVLGASFRSA